MKDLFNPKYSIAEDGKVWSKTSHRFLEPTQGRVKINGELYSVVDLLARAYLDKRLGEYAVLTNKTPPLHYSKIVLCDKPLSTTEYYNLYRNKQWNIK